MGVCVCVCVCVCVRSYVCVCVIVVFAVVTSSGPCGPIDLPHTTGRKSEVSSLMERLSSDIKLNRP